MDNQLDYLFRHQYGKMVSVLTRVFGLAHLETIEDAVQDTFIKAMASWRTGMPDHPKAWLMQASKNRAIDLLRKIKADDNRARNWQSGIAAVALNELFLDEEIEDSQLRMIFTACHPSLKAEDQIAFALKTISGFGTREIAAALLSKEETVKKRLSRARKLIVKENISFSLPDPKQLKSRIGRVLEVIYLIFNEGFHSINKEQLVRTELCGEALRLVKLLLKKETYRLGEVYALFSLMCLHAARLDTRINENNQVISIRDQDRSKWHIPLIDLGSDAMVKAAELNSNSTYLYEAVIAVEHIKAKDVESTDWEHILYCYDKLYELQENPMHLLNRAIVLMQLNKYDEAKHQLDALEPSFMQQRQYLYHCAMAEFYICIDDIIMAVHSLDQAIELVTNISERNYLIEKRNRIHVQLQN